MKKLVVVLMLALATTAFACDNKEAGCSCDKKACCERCECSKG
jgi:hypothetical protein